MVGPKLNDEREVPLGGDEPRVGWCEGERMNPQTIERLDALSSDMPVLVAGPVPDDEIDAAELRVGRVFVPAYRLFMRRYGGAMVGSMPVLGLRRAEVMGDDLFSVVTVTEGFGADVWPATDGWVVVSVDGAGNPIGIADDGGVWTSDHDFGGVGPIASSFEAFVLALLDGVDGDWERRSG